MRIIIIIVVAALFGSCTDKDRPRDRIHVVNNSNATVQVAYCKTKTDGEFISCIGWWNLKERHGEFRKKGRYGEELHVLIFQDGTELHENVTGYNYLETFHISKPVHPQKNFRVRRLQERAYEFSWGGTSLGYEMNINKKSLEEAPPDWSVASFNRNFDGITRVHINPD